ncbi:MAG: hypothetical protein COV46_05905 [Deltaproteobacteria bacterium CG11_big_fil_rev_8_21_14_0_20_49_13]|nr:MAG: hypothetical protein COV46_05905 [Deltaproteobacteria bacterium CG11_big_fil_rev_8_21_14_0_20_49_13]
MKIDLKIIEIYNIIIGLVVSVGVYFIFEDKAVSASLFAGVVIGGLNFWGLYFVFSRLLGSERAPKAFYGILAAVKFVLLIFLLWAAIRLLQLNVVALLAGLSIVIAVVLVAALAGQRTD